MPLAGPSAPSSSAALGGGDETAKGRGRRRAVARWFPDRTHAEARGRPPPIPGARWKPPAPRPPTREWPCGTPDRSNRNSRITASTPKAAALRSRPPRCCDWRCRTGPAPGRARPVPPITPLPTASARAARRREFRDEYESRRRRPSPVGRRCRPASRHPAGPGDRTGPRRVCRRSARPPPCVARGQQDPQHHLALAMKCPSRPTRSRSRTSRNIATRGSDGSAIGRTARMRSAGPFALSLSGGKRAAAALYSRWAARRPRKPGPAPPGRRGCAGSGAIGR